jgi:pimeloyl-ACP methyl ester carboxylesterase
MFNIERYRGKVVVSMGLRLVRAAFSASERMSPSLAGAVAFQLFCRTADPGKLTRGERRAVDGAAEFMASARHHGINLGKRRVVVHEFRPDTPNITAGRVLVTHGWRSRTEFMRAPIEALVAQGYRVYALDFPGHGASSGRRLDLKLAVEAVKAASDWFGPFLAIVGHSFGGAVAVNAAAGSIEGVEAAPTARIVTIASPTVMEDIFDGFGDIVGLAPHSLRHMKASVNAEAGRPLSDFNSRALLTAMPVESLLIHSRDDREVAPYHAELVAGAGKHVTLEWLDGLGHRRVLTDARVVRSIVQFVSAPLVERLAA